MLNETPRDVTVAELQEITTMFNNIGYALSADAKSLENKAGRKVTVEIGAGLLDDGFATVAEVVYAQSDATNIMILKSTDDPEARALPADALKARLAKIFAV